MKLSPERKDFAKKASPDQDWVAFKDVPSHNPVCSFQDVQQTAEEQFPKHLQKPKIPIGSAFIIFNPVDLLQIPSLRDPEDRSNKGIKWGVGVSDLKIIDDQEAGIYFTSKSYPVIPFREGMIIFRIPDQQSVPIPIIEGTTITIN